MKRTSDLPPIAAIDPPEPKRDDSKRPRTELERLLLDHDELLAPQGGAFPVYPRNQVEHKPGDRWVTMTNALARAGAGLTLSEKRIMILAIAKLDSRHDVPITHPVVRIDAKEYGETYKVDPHTAYDALKAAAKALFERKITFYEPEHKRTLTKKQKPPVTEMRWVGRATYQKGDGWIELAFWHEIVPHLMGLKKQFTTYQLQQAHALRSIYSWKLLELLMSFAKDGEGWMQISIEDFCTAMEATEKQRQNFGEIRRRIIEPAVKELRKKDNWLIEWRPVGGGRRVKGLHFAFQRHPQGALPFYE
jgi:plasmid replication initiation protein